LTAVTWPYVDRAYDIGLALGLNVALGGVAYGVGMVKKSGLFAGWMLAAVVCAGLGTAGFVVMASFVLLGSAVSWMGYQRKAALGVAQAEDGARGARHAAAKCIVGVLLAVASLVWPSEALRLAFVASFATALADTVGTELGQLYGKHPVLVTSFRLVSVGTPGAVSLEGTACGILASALVGALGWLLGMFTAAGLAFVVVGAFVGVLIESLVGAVPWLNRLFGHFGRNFLNTAVGALCAGLGRWMFSGS